MENEFSLRNSISKMFSYFNYSKEKITQKENKSNSSLEFIINKYTEFTITDYFTHSKIFLEYDEIEAVIIIMKNCVLLSHLFPEDFNEITENPIFSKLIFSQIYNFEFLVNQGELNSLILLYFEKDFNYKIQSKINFYFGKDSFIIHHFIKKNYILFWQIKFESNILKESESEIYQYHFYVKKINRLGKYQDRILMCSTKFIYNINLKFYNNSFIFSNFKWCDSIRSITKLEVIVEKDLQVRLSIDKSFNKEDNYNQKKIDISSGVKDLRNFNFINENDFNYFLFLVKRLYLQLTNKNLLVNTLKN